MKELWYIEKLNINSFIGIQNLKLEDEKDIVAKIYEKILFIIQCKTIKKGN